MDSHPLGCRNPRIADRVVFDHVIAALVHGSGYERVATPGCSDRTIRRPVAYWAQLGIAGQLHALVLEAYDRMIGRELSELSADGCITKAPCVSDDVRLGVLTEWVTPELVDEVLAECRRGGVKPGALSPRFMVYFTLALALFAQDSYDDVAENLVGALKGMHETVPNRASFTGARQRLGPEVLEMLFRRIGGAVAPDGLGGSFWRGVRLAAVDGFVLDVPDRGEPGVLRRADRRPQGHRVNWASVTVRAFAGPADRRASTPPSRQARRQRSTGRTLTRRSFAMTAVFSPAANLSPA